MTDKVLALTDPPEGYADWLADLKGRIHAAQQRAALAVNTELVRLYWRIGRDILDRQAEQGWGAKVVERLAHDLRNAFPDMKGFSPRNLKYMRAFAEAWPDESFVQGPLARLPWYHQLALLEKLRAPEERSWYAAKAIEYNWSRNILVMQIETRLLERQGSAATNFAESLPAPHSDLARESLKDPIDWTSWGWARRPKSVRSRRRWFGTSPSSCWNSVQASLTSGDRFTLRSAATTSSSIVPILGLFRVVCAGSVVLAVSWGDVRWSRAGIGIIGSSGEPAEAFDDVVAVVPDRHGHGFGCCALSGFRESFALHLGVGVSVDQRGFRVGVA